MTDIFAGIEAALNEDISPARRLEHAKLALLDARAALAAPHDPAACDGCSGATFKCAKCGRSYTLAPFAPHDPADAPLADLDCIIAHQSLSITMRLILQRARDRIAADAERTERAFQILESEGVPRERARHVANGIDVLATRYRRQIATLESRLAAPMPESAQKVCKMLRDMRTDEDILTHQQRTIADAADLIERLARRNAELSADMIALEHKNAELEDRLTLAISELEDAHHAVAGVTRLRAQLAEAQGRNAELETRITNQSALMSIVEGERDAALARLAAPLPEEAGRCADWMRNGFPDNDDHQLAADLIERLARRNAEAEQHIRQLLSLHDDPCPYDAATTRTVARQFLAAGGGCNCGHDNIAANAPIVGGFHSESCPKYKPTAGDGR